MGARSLFEQLLLQIPTIPPGIAYILVGVLACAENIFPPIPADTAIALGAFLSNKGTMSAWAVFGITWVANVGSASAVYLAARTAGRAFFTGKLGNRLVKPQSMARIEALYERHGTWGIFLSRFIPGIRAVIPPFAGVANLGWVRSLVPVAIASGIWYGTLTYVAANLLLRLDDVFVFVARMNRVAAIVAIVLLTGIGIWVVRGWIRRKTVRSK